jgi:Holliday junction resolvasome RuvABC DNA-binding subunit
VKTDKTAVKTPAGAAEREKMLLSALRALGFSKAEARERASEVLERASDRAESMLEGDLIREAFRRSV